MAASFSKLKDNWVRVALSALVLFVFLANATGVFHFAFVELMENLAYDTHLLLTMPDTVDDSVVIVDIDEVSLTAEGRGHATNWRDWSKSCSKHTRSVSSASISCSPNVTRAQGSTF